MTVYGFVAYFVYFVMCAYFVSPFVLKKCVTVCDIKEDSLHILLSYCNFCQIQF